MKFTSIRWRLPASYAGVALLAALALGSLMLLVLNGFYTRQERAYLLSNADMARSMVDQAFQSSLPAEVLQEQIQGLAFLTQAQIRVLAEDGSLLADSGLPGDNQVISFDGSTEGFVVMNVGQGAVLDAVSVDGMPVQPGLSVEMQNGRTQVLDTGAVPIITGSVDTMLPVDVSPFSYGIVSDQSTAAPRSAQVVQVALLSRPGVLEISNGPAYGSEILRSVALAWLGASLAAVTLAALVGMLASRQVTLPVLALTEAARRMQYGDLASRAVLVAGGQAQEFLALAETFNGMAQRVEDTVSTLRAFVSNAAHELNTPLTALRTNLQLAQQEADPAQREIFLGRAVEQNLRLERLTGGLLDLSRLEAAQSAPLLEPLDLAALAAETGERFASRAEQAERAFTLSLPAAPLMVRGNALQLQSLLDNLLENALKFTPPGGSIGFSLEQRSSEVVVQVTDSGIGIPPEDLPHLFTRFQRGRNTAAYPGTGLGLAIVRAIVDLYAGQVEASSAGPGLGSQFIVRLPVLQAKA